MMTWYTEIPYLLEQNQGLFETESTNSSLPREEPQQSIGRQVRRTDYNGRISGRHRYIGRKRL